MAARGSLGQVALGRRDPGGVVQYGADDFVHWRVQGTTARMPLISHMARATAKDARWVVEVSSMYSYVHMHA